MNHSSRTALLGSWAAPQISSNEPALWFRVTRPFNRAESSFLLSRSRAAIVSDPQSDRHLSLSWVVLVQQLTTTTESPPSHRRRHAHPRTQPTPTHPLSRTHPQPARTHGHHAAAVLPRTQCHTRCSRSPRSCSHQQQHQVPSTSTSTPAPGRPPPHCTPPCRPPPCRLLPHRPPLHRPPLHRPPPHRASPHHAQQVLLYSTPFLLSSYASLQITSSSPFHPTRFLP